MTFAAIETQGVDAFLDQIADELDQRTYVLETPWTARSERGLLIWRLQCAAGFSSRLIYVNALMNSFQRDLTQRTQKDFDAKNT